MYAVSRSHRFQRRLAVAGFLVASGFVIDSGIDVSGMSTRETPYEVAYAAASVPLKVQFTDPTAGKPTTTTTTAPKASTLAVADAYISQQSTTADLAVYDLATKSLSSTSSPEATYETASVIKLTVLIGLLDKTESENRNLSTKELTLARQMISVSDNGAATQLWKKIGGPSGAKSILAKIGATNTKPASSWGLTTTTALDQVKVMRVIAEPNNLLTDKSRQLAQDLLSSVTPAQHWGVSEGATSPNDVLLKDGWLAHGKGWVINSVGYVDQDGHSYVVAALSKNNKTQATGIKTIEDLSRIAWNNT